MKYKPSFWSTVSAEAAIHETDTSRFVATVVYSIGQQEHFNVSAASQLLNVTLLKF